MNDEYQARKEPVLTRLIHFIEDIWPSVYRIINDILAGIVNFIKETVSGLWR